MNARRLSGWLLSLLVLLSACSRTPEAPASTPAAPAVAADISGTWEGQYRETRCTSASCPQCCSARFKGGPRSRDFRLTLRQNAANMTGTFEEILPPGGSPLQGTVSGRLVGARLELTGSLGWMNTAWTDVYGFADLRMPEATVLPDAQSITGSFVLLDRHSDRSEFMERTCEIVSLRRTP